MNKVYAYVMSGEFLAGTLIGGFVVNMLAAYTKDFLSKRFSRTRTSRRKQAYRTLRIAAMVKDVNVLSDYRHNELRVRILFALYAWLLTLMVSAYVLFPAKTPSLWTFAWRYVPCLILGVVVVAIDHFVRETTDDIDEAVLQRWRSRGYNLDTRPKIATWSSAEPED